MILAAAQINSRKDNLEYNIKNHLKYISLAVRNHADLILFPELSLTSYDAKRAHKVVCIPGDSRLEVFKRLSTEGRITICAGVPTSVAGGIQISMLIFEPDKPVSVYSKRWLHIDELPYFIPGEKALNIKIGGKWCAPAICYESTVMDHTIQAHKDGAEVYLASVADSAAGLEKAYRIYPEISKKFGMTVLLSNGVGPADDFMCKGGSSVWNSKGELMGQLGENDEGILIYGVEKDEILILSN